MLNLSSARLSARFTLVARVAVSAVLLCAVAFTQTTIGTGSIVGTVTDPAGAMVSGAKVIITNTGTGQSLNMTTNSSGAYALALSILALTRCKFRPRASAASTKRSEWKWATPPLPISSCNLARRARSLKCRPAAVAVNTEQAEVQGVLNSEQIANLPVNGRNFLDLAQLEPGVQIQDGQNFDPTKAGYSSISFGGRFGRTARINVDGVDISDETVGTTTADIPASAIEEFQLGQSSLDLSQGFDFLGRGQCDHQVGHEHTSR